ncbi:acyltransferase [Thermobrachium celere]|uniref:acyltransferase n=1 Tax=Thermobrachium celere TaxID=53422 RepID=UPI0019458DD0|nr:acyltransferase [Thermobrachium celere]GFR35996.1 hypothetical protein TCEA9_18080 [Thermobrachium celere]
MKKVLKILYIKISKLLMPIIFDKKYLKGRWFEENDIGWKWCWRSLLFQKILGFNRHVPFPVSHNIIVARHENIEFDINDLNNFQHFGCYFQNWGGGKIKIGRGTYIAPNVGLITENHNINNLDMHNPPEDIIIGKCCWIGMNSVILPGVQLGDHTIVGAGSVVTHSFKEGYCIIGGCPAKIIKHIDKNKL